MKTKPTPVFPADESMSPTAAYIAVHHAGRWTVIDRSTGESVHENPDGEELTKQRAEEFAATLNRNPT